MREVKGLCIYLEEVRQGCSRRKFGAAALSTYFLSDSEINYRETNYRETTTIIWQTPNLFTLGN